MDNYDKLYKAEHKTLDPIHYISMIIMTNQQFCWLITGNNIQANQRLSTQKHSS